MSVGRRLLLLDRLIVYIVSVARASIYVVGRRNFPNAFLQDVPSKTDFILKASIDEELAQRELYAKRRQLLRVCACLHARRCYCEV